MASDYSCPGSWLLIQNLFRLLGICGSVGSGKSSLISTILGQLRIEKGSLALEGSIAYVPQQAWIFHDSARENILFGKKYDERKYNKGNLITETLKIVSKQNIFGR